MTRPTPENLGRLFTQPSEVGQPDAHLCLDACLLTSITTLATSVLTQVLSMEVVALTVAKTKFWRTTLNYYAMCKSVSSLIIKSLATCCQLTDGIFD